MTIPPCACGRVPRADDRFCIACGRPLPGDPAPWVVPSLPVIPSTGLEPGVVGMSDEATPTPGGWPTREAAAPWRGAAAPDPAPVATPEPAATIADAAAPDSLTETAAAPSGWDRERVPPGAAGARTVAPRPPQRRRQTVLVSIAVIAALLGVGILSFEIANRAASIGDPTATATLSAAPPTAAPAALPMSQVAVQSLGRVVTVEAQQRGNREELGTGWLLDDRGDFVTNAHVLDSQVLIRLRDRAGGTHVGQLMGIDVSQDVAVVRASGGFEGTALPISTTVPTSPLDVVILSSTRATGHSDVTTGRVTSLHETVPLGSTDTTPNGSAPQIYRDMLSIDAQVYQGNSGGPVLDARGTVVGIVTLASPTPPRAFAIPIGRVVDELHQFASRAQPAG